MNKFLLLTFFVLLLTLVSFGQENLAKKADYLTTSFVSSWEKLSAVNDGIEPSSSADKQGAAYGNWNNNDNNRWHWVEYRWNQLQMISKSEIYWWADGSGIQIPTACYLQYWDFLEKNWVEVSNSRGPGIANQYHSIEFQEILTNRVRINMISPIATGILEWRVWGRLGEQVPMNTTSAIDKPLTKGEESKITLKARNTDGTMVSGYQFKLDVSVKNDITTTNENYLINGQIFDQTLLGYVLNPTDENGETTFSVSIPQQIDPNDGISISPKFNNGTTGLGVVYAFSEPGKTAPTLSIVDQKPTVDADIEFSFADDQEWRSAVKTLTVNNQVLVTETDYILSAGKLILKPSGANAILIHSGAKSLKIEAPGYNPVLASFNLLPGSVDVVKSTVLTQLKLSRGVSTKIVLTVNDKFGNPIPNHPVKFDVEKTNLSQTTNEAYAIGTVSFTSSQTALSFGTTNSSGQVAQTITIPLAVDKNDGVALTFTSNEGKTFDQKIKYICAATEKTARIQNQARQQPDFSWQRTAQSENFVIIWGEKVNGDPSNKTNNSKLWFIPEDILKWLEAMYIYYSDSMAMLDINGANIKKYKIELVMNNTWRNDVFTGWAFGSQADNIIGSMWIDPAGVRDNSVLAHEFTHACQAQIVIDKPGYGLNTPAAGFFWESHANWTRAIYNKTHDGLPERYINTSMMHFSVTRRHYQNFAFLDYVYDHYGVQTVSNIWRKASASKSHPLTSFRDSVMHITQDELNDELARCAMHNVTWDYSVQADILNSINSVDQIYIAREYTILDSLKDEPGKFIVPEYLAPGDYGYNIIPLYVNNGANSITVSFRVLENQPAGGSGARYGFVAVNSEGKIRYSPVYSEKDATATFSVEPGDQKLFMVVSGAPKTHHNYEWEVGFPRVYRYPYVVGFDGAVPAGHQPGYNSRKASVPGAPHPNGGGWVASTAKVDATAYVGPNAQVLGTAQVSGNARVEGYALVTGSAKVREKAIVKDHAIVGTTANLSGNVVVEKTSRVYGTTAVNNVVVTGSALVYNSTLAGNVVMKDLAWFSGVSLSGTAIMGGDAEEYTGCSSGTYLEIKRLDNNCDGNVNHPYDQEVNPNWPEYIWPKGTKPSSPTNLQASDINDTSVELVWDASNDDDAVKYYVFQGGVVVATVSGNSHRVTGLGAGKSYTFMVQAIDSRGNRSSKSNTLMVKTSSVGVAQTGQENWITIFPNPVAQQLNIKLAGNEEARVSIVNLLGQTLIDQTFQHNLSIPAQDIGPAGIYTIMVRQKDKVINQIVMVR